MLKIMFRDHIQLVQWLKLQGDFIAKLEYIEVGINTIYPIKMAYWPMIY